MTAAHIRIYRPGHPNGHKTRWLWSICTEHEELDCGTAESAEDALADAMIRHEAAEIP